MIQFLFAASFAIQDSNAHARTSDEAFPNPSTSPKLEWLFPLGPSVSSSESVVGGAGNGAQGSGDSAGGVVAEGEHAALDLDMITTRLCHMIFAVPPMHVSNAVSCLCCCVLFFTRTLVD